MDGRTHIITIFGSSRPRPGDPEYMQASELGGELARGGLTVCNGGYGGIMEASARGAREAGGRTVGVVCSIFGDRQANPWTVETVMTHSLPERLEKLVSLGDGYVVLKGGTGTLLEFSMVWEMMNKKMMHRKPIVLLGSFWEGVVETLRSELTWEGLEDCTHYVTLTRTPAECAGILKKRLLPI